VPNTPLSKRSSASDSRQFNRMYKQFSSVLFKTCSSLNKSTQQTANIYYKYTEIYNNFFSTINNTTFWVSEPYICYNDRKVFNLYIFLSTKNNFYIITVMLSIRHSAHGARRKDGLFVLYTHTGGPG
jgi:hypothetical protein